MIVKLIDSYRDRSKKLIRLGYKLLALVVLVDVFLVSKEHAHTSLEHFPGFWALFGFFACLLIILVSKLYGNLGIRTREDYYDN